MRIVSILFISNRFYQAGNSIEIKKFNVSLVLLTRINVKLNLGTRPSMDMPTIVLWKRVAQIRKVSRSLQLYIIFMLYKDKERAPI